MKASIVSKLNVLVDRHEELGMLLSDSDVIADQDKYRLFSTEYSAVSYTHLTLPTILLV